MNSDFTARARAVGIRSDRDWPYGAAHHADAAATQQRLVEWAEANGLVLAKGACTHWLANGRCRDLDDNRGWRDHSTGWNIDGKPAMLLTQPYEIGTGDLAELAALVLEGYEIIVGTSMRDGWYGCGTLAIQIWIPRQFDKSQSARAS